MDTRISVLLVTVSLYILGTSAAAAIVFGGSNLGYLGYPSHSCYPPYSKPIKPYSFNSQWELDQYNAEVDRYNAEMRVYGDCIREYVENAENDLRRINEKVDEAIAEYNSQ